MLVSAVLSIKNNDLDAQMPDFHKKIEKTIKKTWKGQAVKAEIFDVKKEGFTFPDRQLYYLKENGKKIGILVINKAYGCHIGGCDDVDESRMSISSTAYEDFYYAIFFNLDLTIKLVKVLEYDSEYGYEICAKRWLQQFVGNKGCDLQYMKDIDGISGATVSAQSIVSDIDNLCWLLSDFTFGN